MEGDAAGTGALAKDGDAVRVSAKEPNIVLHPGERELLIQEPKRAIGRALQLIKREKPEIPKPVIERHENGAVGGEVNSVKHGLRGATRDEKPAMNPHHDRES